MFGERVLMRPDLVPEPRGVSFHRADGRAGAWLAERVEKRKHINNAACRIAPVAQEGGSVQALSDDRERDGEAVELVGPVLDLFPEEFDHLVVRGVVVGGLKDEAAWVVRQQAGPSGACSDFVEVDESLGDLIVGKQGEYA